jgi:methionyl-tRNA synthetase
MLKRYRDGTVPAPANDLSADAARAIADVCAQLERNELQAALQSIWALITRANQFVDQTAPFKLAKDPAQAQRLDEVLYNLVETCRIIAVLLWPFLPTTSCRINEQLGLSGAPDQFTGAHWGGLKQGHAIGAPVPLFPRKEP